MLLDLLAWALLLPIASIIGNAVLVLLGAQQMLAGDRRILAAWIGVVLVSVALLGVSIVAPLAAGPATLTVMALAGPALWIVIRDRRASTHRRNPPDVPIARWRLLAGIAGLALGAAALTSDPVTLYDSLVYHVGVIRWLREQGTVPGMALIHNRLGHASAWFALAAPFDSGIVTHRAFTIPLGAAMLLVGGQGALGAARILGRTGRGSDWFLALTSLALGWAIAVYNAASPSPDVVTNALIVTIAWALQVVGRVPSTARHRTWQALFTPRLLPFVLAVGACAMKLFALPTAVATAAFYVFLRGENVDASLMARRALTCTVVGAIIIAPLIAVNTIATGCPLFPSPIGCTHATWSIGTAAAADYASYIRDVARWDSRRTAAGLSWVPVWISAHPVVVMFAVLTPIIAYVALRGPRRDGVRSVLLVAVLGIVFAWWQAPAPRFLYAFAIIAPLLAVSYWLASLVGKRTSTRAPLSHVAIAGRAGTGFLVFAAVTGLSYTVASQKLNVLSALRGEATGRARLRSEFLFPAAPESPPRLYRWRVNDVDVLTAVPRPIADTLGYRSAIPDTDVAFEKCSTAPLPCTPYLPKADVRLRVPARGLAGGFRRAPNVTVVSAEAVQCVGEVVAPFSQSMLSEPPRMNGASPCGERASTRDSRAPRP